MSGILGYFKDKNEGNGGLALSGATAGGSHEGAAARPSPANIAAANITQVHESAGRPGSMTNNSQSSSKPASSSEQPYQSPAQQLARERAAAAKAQIAARKAMEAERKNA